MTPLVDIAFLLLTFFMLSTNLNTPQVMEMAIPPENTNIDVKESELMMLFVRDDGKIFYKLGNEAYTAIEMKDIRKFAVEQNIRVKNRLITGLKIGTGAKYELVIKMLDELNLAEVDITAKLREEAIKRERRFALNPMTDKEKEELRNL